MLYYSHRIIRTYRTKAAITITKKYWIISNSWLVLAVSNIFCSRYSKNYVVVSVSVSNVSKSWRLLNAPIFRKRMHFLFSTHKQCSCILFEKKTRNIECNLNAFVHILSSVGMMMNMKMLRMMKLMDDDNDDSSYAQGNWGSLMSSNLLDFVLFRNCHCTEHDGFAASASEFKLARNKKTNTFELFRAITDRVCKQTQTNLACSASRTPTIFTSYVCVCVWTRADCVSCWEMRASHSVIAFVCWFGDDNDDNATQQRQRARPCFVCAKVVRCSFHCTCTQVKVFGL